MFILPKGITGFGSISLGQNVSLFRGEKQFKADCYQAAHTLKFKIKNFGRPDYPRNYCFCVIQTNQRTENFVAAVLCNAVYNVLAFSKVKEEFLEPFEFVDLLELNEVFGTMGYVVLSESFANGPPNAEITKNLSPIELKELNYWKPAKIADIVFNCWD